MLVVAGTAVGQLKYVVAGSGVGVHTELPTNQGVKTQFAAKEAAATSATSSCKTFFEVDRARKITALCAAAVESDSSRHVLIARASGEVDLVRLQIKDADPAAAPDAVIATHKIFVKDAAKSRATVIGLDMVSPTAALLALETGKVFVFEVTTGKVLHERKLEFEGLKSVCERGSKPHLLVLRVWRTHRNIVAFGGHGVNVGVIELHGEKRPASWMQNKFWNGPKLNANVFWSARNQPNDSLDLQCKVDVSDIAFVELAGEPCIAACSSYGEIKVYRPADESLRRRAACVFVVPGKQPLRCIADASLGNENAVVVGGSRGAVSRVLVQKRKCRVVQNFRGNTGAVTGVQVTKTKSGNHLASVGFDRTIRLWNLDSPTLASKWYTKQELCCVEILANEGEQGPSANAKNIKNMAHDDEDVWENLEEAESNSKKSRSKKRKRKSDEDDSENATEKKKN